MQAGRELDVKVAEALGYQVNKISPDYFILVDGEIDVLPYFSSRWAGMGLLMDEALKQGIAFRLETRFMVGSFIDYACLVSDGNRLELASASTAPHATCLAFSKLKGIETDL
ncbi:hypothetical protein SD939_10445 [Lactobacillus crispatus]|uniref:hypothetical protein n=1 Tax=Lactobacillus crispatus TaxID=47770 RepID=UPI0029C34A8F|nr:hypothetical protein [Lactobacillus crispatus]MDX5091625.1 hypothetical protein [Lactobacillus crispatus]